MSKTIDEAIDEIMKQVQIYASAYSAVEGGRFDFGNRLPEDERTALRSMLVQLLTAERKRAEAVIKPFADLGDVILSEAPPEATFIAIFKNCEGDWYDIEFDTLRAASAFLTNGETDENSR